VKGSGHRAWGMGHGAWGMEHGAPTFVKTTVGKAGSRAQSTGFKDPLLGDRNEVEIPRQRKPAPLRRGVGVGYLEQLTELNFITRYTG